MGQMKAGGVHGGLKQILFFISQSGVFSKPGEIPGPSKFTALYASAEQSQLGGNPQFCFLQAKCYRIFFFLTFRPNHTACGILIS